MIKHIVLSILVLGLLSFSASHAESAGICDCCGCKDCVSAFYFHTNMRCATCKTIEQYTKEAIEKSFGEQLKTHKLCLQIINTDEKGNEHFMQDYQLYTKAVVLCVVMDGKEVKFANLTRIWELTQNKEAFEKYITAEVGKYLKEL